MFPLYNGEPAAFLRRITVLVACNYRPNVFGRRRRGRGGEQEETPGPGSNISTLKQVPTPIAATNFTPRTWASGHGTRRLRAVLRPQNVPELGGAHDAVAVAVEQARNVQQRAKLDELVLVWREIVFRPRQAFPEKASLRCLTSLSFWRPHTARRLQTGA
jgi:hypothetical protein